MFYISHDGVSSLMVLFIRDKNEMGMKKQNNSINLRLSNRSNAWAILIASLVLLVSCTPTETVTVKEPPPEVNQAQQRAAQAAQEQEKLRLRNEAQLRYELMVKELELKQVQQQLDQQAAEKLKESEPVVRTSEAAPVSRPVKQKAETVKAAPPPPKRQQTYRTGQEVSGQNRLYDQTNPSYDLIQKANESLKGFPTNRIGEVDWMVAINEKMVTPRSDVQGRTKPELLDLDIIMKETRDMDYVRFPHLAHTKWLACKNCHDKIFKPKIGAQDIDMNKIFSGQYCGVCHDRVAFSVFICENCHSVPH
jgi:c(7)-type cytochrome triheme protein